MQNMQKKRCYIYTRVSTSMQVDGYSLDAQRERLRREAARRDMLAAGEFPYEGKIGQNISGGDGGIDVAGQELTAGKALYFT